MLKCPELTLLNESNLIFFNITYDLLGYQSLITGSAKNMDHGTFSTHDVILGFSDSKVVTPSAYSLTVHGVCV